MNSLLIAMMLILPFFQSTGYLPADRYKIIDGNGNDYVITDQGPTVEYIPMKPENSSSGTYSGGAYVKKTISREQYSELLKRIGQVLDNKKIRIKDRVKGSFMIISTRDGRDRIYLVTQESQAVKEMEASLKQLIQ